MQLVFPLSYPYQTVTRWLRTMSAHFKLAHDVGFTSRSFRRGGATDLLTRNYAIDFIVNLGRWASERSCKDYLRRGEVVLPKLRARTDPAVWRNLLLFTKLGASAWDLDLVRAHLTEVHKA